MSKHSLPKRNYLPNGNYYTDFAVNPVNWRNKKASVKNPWYFTYQFYDAALNKRKTVACRGMNAFKTQQERMETTEQLLKDEIAKLSVEGLNPFTNEFSPFCDQVKDIIPEMPIYQALTIAHRKYKCSENTRKDIGYMMNHIQPSITRANLNYLAIGTVKRKHIIQILEACAQIKKPWTPHIFNKYRTYLQMLFKVIVKYQILEHNPVDEYIEREKTVKRIRETLTHDERDAISKALNTKVLYTFYRLIQIFFHSGCRVVELMNVKYSDVDIKKQRFKVLVLKGGVHQEVWKTIKDVALPYWQELLSEANWLLSKGVKNSEIFLFSEWLKPGLKAIRRDQVTKRWHMHVKEKLKIDADFYSLKHLNSTETIDAEEAAADAAAVAAAQNSHKGSAMVVNIYDVKRDERKHERIKKLNNHF